MMGNHAREQGGRMHWCWKSIWNGNAFVAEARMKNLQELPKLRDSITYLYLEHAAIEQNDAAIIAIPKDGLPIPIAAMTCLLLGSGTSVTHAVFVQFVKMDVWRSGAVKELPVLCGGNWRDEKRKESALFMDEVLHMQAVRRMYALRFPKVKTDHLTLQQIRGMEGIRVRKAYELARRITGVKWNKRFYKNPDCDMVGPVNQAMSEADAMLMVWLVPCCNRIAGLLSRAWLYLRRQTVVIRI